MSFLKDIDIALFQHLNGVCVSHTQRDRERDVHAFISLLIY